MDGRVTNGLRIGWLTPLAFFERKTDWLRRMEDSDLLHAFFVREMDTGARIGPSHHELRIGARGVLAVLYPPEESGEPIREAIRQAVTELAPPRLRSMSVFTQHVRPLDATYEDARRRLTNRLVGPLGEDDDADSAVLFERRWHGGHANVEFGVVNREELSDRLLGGVGRAHPPRDAISGRRLPDGLPSVSLYVEANYSVDLPPKGVTVDWSIFLMDGWRAAEEESERTADALVDHAFKTVRSSEVDF